MNKLQKNYLYIEERDSNGVLIKIEEVKRTSDYSTISKLYNELSSNKIKDAQKAEQLIYEEKQNAIKKSKELELERFDEKYSLKNFLIAAQWCIMLGKVEDLKDINHLLEIDDKHELALSIENVLNKVEFLEVKKLFDKMF